MKFNDYNPLRNRWGDEVPFMEHFSHIKRECEFRDAVASYIDSCLQRGLESIDRNGWSILAALRLDVATEARWCAACRPYYNVWPPIFDLADNLRIGDIACRDAFGPLSTVNSELLIRFPIDQEPFGVKSAMFSMCGDRNLKLNVRNSSSLFVFLKDEYPIREIGLDRSEYGNSLWATEFGYEQFQLILKIIATIALLSDDSRLISPVVLSADRFKFDGSKDELARKLMVQRAINKSGMTGFDLGRELHEQQERGEISPHYRNAHLALQHYGPRNSKTKIILRSGSMVLSKKMREVPTGYLGEEE